VRRDLRALADAVRDVLVIGGGIHGACTAWDAVLRGLTVCLVERADFASGTSANSMKIIHGGLRYLQDGDYRRMRESIGERRALLRIAPHLVHPLPVVVPTRGRGLHGRAALRVALALNDLLGGDRNVGLDREHRLPRGRMLTRRECLALAPELDGSRLTGAGVFYDAHVHNSERLVLAFLRSAVKAGVDVANYAEVTGARRDRDGLLRVIVHDRLEDTGLVIRARAVVNATGPWVDEVIGLARPSPRPLRSFARAFNVVTRRLFGQAIALPARDEARGRAALVGRATRMLFIVPWRNHSLIGTSYEPHDGRSCQARVTEADVARLLAAVNAACPSLALGLDDVRLVHGGLLPLADTEHGQLAKQGRIIDHAEDDVPGLLSIVGVKYTTARLMAERTVNRVFEGLGRRPPRSLSAVEALHGGEPASRADAFAAPSAAGHPDPLVAGYGSAYGEVLAHLAPGESAGDPAALLRAEVRHAVRAEMAQTLADVVFRRTDLGSAGDPGPERLGVAAQAAAVELGWTVERARAELRDVYGRFGVPR
jgi:glycerol-3-phosphate dehydrogenase